MDQPVPFVKTRPAMTTPLIVVAVGALLWSLLGITGPVSAAATWGDATPAAFGAVAQASPPYSEIRSVSCASPGNCSALGEFSTASGGYELFTITSVNGVWGQVTPLMFNSGDAATGATAMASAGSISCPTAGNCVAVGSFRNAQFGIEPFTMTSTNGTWGPVTRVNFGSISIPALGSRYGKLNSVSCTSVGNCSAVGGFRNTSSGYEAFVVTSTNGMWADASTVNFPSGLQQAQGASRSTYLRSVSCYSAGNCAASGAFRTQSQGPNSAEVFTVSVSGGTVGSAEVLTYASAPATGANADSFAYQTSCAPTGDCTTVGYYANAQNEYLAMAASTSNGVWGAAVVPAFGTGIENSSPDSFFTSVSCPSVGSCAAVGRFRNSQSGFVTEGFAVFLSNGSWAQASPITFDQGVQSATPNSQVESVSCPTAGNCTAVGRFRNAAGGQEAFVMTSTAGVWGNATPVRFASGVQIGNANASANLNSVSCASVGNCVGVGYFVMAGSGSDYGAFSVASVDNTPAPTTTPTTVATTAPVETTVAPPVSAGTATSSPLSTVPQIQLPATGSQLNYRWLVVALYATVAGGVLIARRRRTV